MNKQVSKLTPTLIAKELDKHIIGQNDAKKAVAIALRNRYRRSKIKGSIKNDIIPKNILMIGSTGVGKTEIARRLASLVEAPFVKVEASKYTEVGYVGRDVESMIRDLAEVGYQMIYKKHKEGVKKQAQDMTENKLLDLLYNRKSNDDVRASAVDETREKMREKLRNGDFDEKMIDVDIKPSTPEIDVFGIGGGGFEDLQNSIQDMFKNVKTKQSKRKISIKDAKKVYLDQMMEDLVDERLVKEQALIHTSENGVVFIDELDKVAKSEMSGGSVSREGVQRDLLPLIEGSEVKTRIGMINTQYILFIAAGAFHQSKPSDLISELQGRFPIRVELDSLKVEDFERILQEPSSALIKQYAALMAVESMDLKFSKQAIRRLAEIAFHINENIENIGARRLYTVMEKLIEKVSFDMPEAGLKELLIDKDYVDSQLTHLATNEDLSRYIL